jgi:hypothetical protein
VGRYRERWEKLKEGARVRREGNGNVSGNANGAGATSKPAVGDKTGMDRGAAKRDAMPE